MATSFRFKLRRGLAAEWAAVNPVLLDGEPGVETDTGGLKLGNGTTAWNDLDYSGYRLAEILAAAADEAEEQVTALEEGLEAHIAAVQTALAERITAVESAPALKPLTPTAGVDLDTLTTRATYEVGTVELAGSLANLPVTTPGVIEVETTASGLVFQTFHASGVEGGLFYRSTTSTSPLTYSVWTNLLEATDSGDGQITGILVGADPNDPGTFFPVDGSGGSSTLGGLSDVNTDGVTDGQVLAWDDTTKMWAPADGGIGDGGGGGGGGGLLTSAVYQGWFPNLSATLYEYNDENWPSYFARFQCVADSVVTKLGFRFNVNAGKRYRYALVRLKGGYHSEGDLLEIEAKIFESDFTATSEQAGQGVAIVLDVPDVRLAPERNYAAVITALDEAKIVPWWQYNQYAASIGPIMLHGSDNEWTGGGVNDLSLGPNTFLPESWDGNPCFGMKTVMVAENATVVGPAQFSDAYALWLAEGNTGTHAEYQQWLRGDKGEMGAPGFAGAAMKSATALPHDPTSLAWSSTSYPTRGTRLVCTESCVVDRLSIPINAVAGRTYRVWWARMEWVTNPWKVPRVVSYGDDLDVNDPNPFYLDVVATTTGLEHLVVDTTKLALADRLKLIGEKGYGYFLGVTDLTGEPVKIKVYKPVAPYTGDPLTDFPVGPFRTHAPTPLAPQAGWSGIDFPIPGLYSTSTQIGYNSELPINLDGMAAFTLAATLGTVAEQSSLSGLGAVAGVDLTTVAPQPGNALVYNGSTWRAGLPAIANDGSTVYQVDDTAMIAEGSTSTSTSAFNYKGEAFVVSQPVRLKQAITRFNHVAGFSYKAVLAEVNGAVVTRVLATSPVVTALAAATMRKTFFDLDADLVPGVTYALLIGRSDPGTTTTYGFPLNAGGLTTRTFNHPWFDIATTYSYRGAMTEVVEGAIFDITSASAPFVFYLRFTVTSQVQIDGSTPGAKTLDELTDVDTTTTAPVPGQALLFTNDGWRPAQVPAPPGTIANPSAAGAALSYNGANVASTSGTRNVAFDTVDRLDTGFTASAPAGTVTVGVDGWYAVSGHVRLASNVAGNHAVSVITGDGTAVLRADQQDVSTVELGVNGLAWLAAGTVLRLSYFSSSATVVIGGASGAYTNLRVVALTGPAGPTGPTGAPSDLTVKIHGADAFAARPNALVVHWYGSVAPANAITRDEWIEETA